MKKIILAAVSMTALASIDANAATESFCNGGGIASNSTVTPTNSTDGTTFVRVPFAVKCSANIHLVGDDNVTYYRVGATSVKGKNAFGGSTMGGGVSGSVCGNTTLCGASDAQAAATNAASS